MSGCTSRSVRSMLRHPVVESAGGRGRAHETFCRGGIFLERHEIAWARRQSFSQTPAHPVIDRAGGLSMSLCTASLMSTAPSLRRSDNCQSRASPIWRAARRSTRAPWSLTGSSTAPSPGLRRAPHRRPSPSAAASRSDLVGPKRATLKLVGKVTCSTLIFSPGGRIACGFWAAQGQAARVEIIPDAGIGVGRLDRRSVAVARGCAPGRARAACS